jgi:hypothetical protein
MTASRPAIAASPRAVVDTSSLVPPMLRRELQQAAQLGLFTAIWSPWIIAELNRVLVWRWVKDPPPGRPRDDLSDANERRGGEMANRMMEWLLPSFELVAPLPPYPPPWEELSDRWDHPIWAAAVSGGAQYVISEDTRHFPPRQADGRHVHQGIEYLCGRAFLDRL